MPLTRLDITDFRNISSTRADPIPDGFNLFFGNNGSGKTSLLESIYYLGMGRSFRSTPSNHIVRNSAHKFSIYSHLTTLNGQVIPVGVERNHSGRSLTARVDGKNVESIAEIANLLPVQLLNSHCHHLLDGGPQFRRKYLDWGVFYYKKDFISIWRQFKRILQQRNSALARKVSKKEMEAWTNQLVESALTLHEQRQDYVSHLFPILTKTIGSLLELTDLKIEYYPGWDFSKTYGEILGQSLEKDLLYGYTQLGPHKANIHVTINDLPAKDILSRGQQKLFVCAMILAQGALLFHDQNKRLVYLVDDLPSELDPTSRVNLIDLLSQQEAQIFVTAVEREIFKGCSMTKPVKLFHVEHGNLTQLEF